MVLVNPRAGHYAHVSGAGLCDDAGDLVTMFGEDGLQTGCIVVVDDDRVRGLCTGDARGVGQEKVARPEPAWARSASTCPW